MWQRTWVLGTLGLAVLAVSAGAVLASIHRAHVIAAVLVRTAIPIDPHAGEWFTPPARDVVPALTAGQAYTAYEHQTGGRTGPLPSNLTVRLGLLTSPIGEPARLAYGYAWAACRRHTGPKVLGPASRCLSWLFVDATTGQMIEAVLYRHGPSHRP